MAGDVRQLAGDFGAFTRALVIPGASGPVRFGDAMAPFQSDTFAALSPDLRAVARGERPECGRHWIERTKGGSKDTDCAAAILWLLAFAPRRLEVQVGAGDQQQAQEVRKAAADLLRLNEWLGRCVTVQSDSLLNPRSGSRCDILTTDAATSHGARPDVVLANELSHVQSEEFVATLFDNLTKNPRGLGIIASNAGFCQSWQERWRDAFKAAGRWAFHVWDKPAPWIDARDLAEAELRNAPCRFKRLYWGVWATDSGDALEGAWIDRAIVHSGPMVGRVPGWRFAAGLDLSLSRDWTALAVVARSLGHGVKTVGRESRPVSRLEAVLNDIGPSMFAGDEEPWEPFRPRPAPTAPTYEVIEGSGKTRLAYLKTWKPTGREIDLGAVEAEVLRLHRLFGLATVFADKWQAAALVQNLRRANVNAVAIDATGGTLESQAGELLRLFGDDKVELYPCDLVDDLRKLRLVERAYGVRMESPRAKGKGHGDAASAFALGLLALKKLRGGPPRVPAGRRLAW